MSTKRDGKLPPNIDFYYEMLTPADVFRIIFIKRFPVYLKKLTKNIMCWDLI